MTFRDALAIFEHWEAVPPVNEMLATLARVYTTWEPKHATPVTEEERAAAHRASLEARWKAGAMNVKQMLDATGGRLSLDGSAGPADMGGIGPFPGTVH